MAQQAGGGPFGEFDFGFHIRAEPDVFVHFVDSDAFAPLTGFAGWQIRKGAFVRG